MAERRFVRSPARSNDLLPDAETDLLLRAALGREENAREAWLALDGRLDVDTLVVESHELLASVATTLRELKLAPVELPRFEGIRKRLWAMNIRKVRVVAGGVAALRDIGIEPTVTGSLAVLAHHGDLGVRHITEADIVVPAHRAAAAQQALEANDWQNAGRRTDGFLLDMRAARFTRDGVVVTLRWSVTSAIDQTAWPDDAASAAIDVVGSRLTVASPAAALAFSLVDGLGIPGYVASRRIADVARLCQPGRVSEPDWESFSAIVITRRGAWEAHAQLAYAASTLNVAVPPELLAHLAANATRRATVESAAERLRSRLPRALLRRARGRHLYVAVISAPRLIREVWEFPSSASLLRRVARRTRWRRGP